jgi:hypothetical protein
MNLFQPFLNELAHVLEFNHLEPDQYGVCLIELKKDPYLLLLFEPDTKIVKDSILISTTIDQPPAFTQSFLMWLLSHFSQTPTTISLQFSPASILLHIRVSAHIKHPQLKAVLDFFIQDYRLLKQGCAQPPSYDDQTSVAKSP